MSAYFDNINVVSGTLNIGSGTAPNYDIILSDSSGIATQFNINNKNIDLMVEGTSNDKFLYFDASTGRLGLGVNDPDAPLHIVSSCAAGGLKIENLTNCTTGVRVLLLHNTQTAPETGSYPATIDLAGRDNNYNEIIYGQIRARILGSATSQTSGEMIFTVDHTGVNRTVFRSSLVNTVLGGLNIATGHNYNVIGYNNNLSGLSYINVGSQNIVTTATGIILGNNNYVSGEKILIIANDTDSIGSNNIVFSTDATVSGINNVIIGNLVSNTGNTNVLIGNNNSVSGNNLVGLLNNAAIVGSSGIGFGSHNIVSGDKNIYIGNNIGLSGSSDVAVGSYISITGSNNIVYGSESDVSGSSIVSIGTDNNPINVTSGIYIGSNISIADSQRSVIIGLGNSTTSGLDESVVLGINNTTNSAAPTGLLVIGQSNSVSAIKDSLIIGNRNNLSGTVANNVVVGPRNATPSTSINNIVFGTMNNVSGARIYTDGSIVGQPVRVDGSMSNSNIFGTNNIASRASGTVIIGNRSLVSGIDINTVGSLNNLQGANHLQNIGNSNVVVGDHNTTIGNRIDLVGSNSIVISTEPVLRSQVFGSGNIVLGSNEVVTSGLAVGQDNEIYGPLNIIYGNNNIMGSVRHPFTMNPEELSHVIIQGNVNDYAGGDKVLINIYAPGSRTTTSYVRNILDGDEDGQPLGVLKENVGLNFTTTLVISVPVDTTNSIPYSTINNFDGSYNTSTTISGYVSLLQKAAANQDDTIAAPLYGFRNTLIGYQNRCAHSSGIVLGSNNRVSGVKHIVIGHGISGYYDNTVQIGSNNTNKIVLDDFKIVFNTGEFQNVVYFNSSNGDNGINNIRAMKIDLTTNRVGLNNDSPRSTLDVSGILTTSAVRIGLSATPGHMLTANSSGVGSWQLPVNLSGTNSGLLFKTSDKLGSGIREIVFNGTSRELYYLRGDREAGGSISLDDATSIEERPVIFSPSGLFINDAGNDYGYNLVVKGSGIREDVEGDLSVYLLRTRIGENAIQVYNLSGVSGYLNHMTCTDQLRVPVSLTGTLLYANNQGNLLSKTFAPYSILYTANNFASTGSNTFRYYPTQQVLTIGSTGTPPLAADSSLLLGASNAFNHIILGSSAGISTVFNNAGLHNQFMVVNMGEAAAQHRYGLIYDTSGVQPILGNYDPGTPGSLGIGVKNNELWVKQQGQNGGPWWEAGKLVVNGHIRATSLQLTPNGRTSLPGTTLANKYLKIDQHGYVNLGNVLEDFNFTFSGIHPLAVTINPTDDSVRLALSSETRNGSPLGTSSNGLLLAYNGAAWEQAVGLRVYQPALTSAANTNLYPGIAFGGDLALNSCLNNHVFGGGGLVRNNSSFAGSAQNSRFYLRGRTIGDNTSELVANWEKTDATASTITPLNTISIQYLPNGVNSSTDHRQSFVWKYTIDFVGIFSDDKPLNVRKIEGCAGRLEGSLISYMSSAGVRYANKIGDDVMTLAPRFSSSSVAYPTSVPPISVVIRQTDQEATNGQRLAIMARGRDDGGNSLSPMFGMWSTTVEIQQVMMPSGVPFGGTTITPG